MMMTISLRYLLVLFSLVTSADSFLPFHFNDGPNNSQLQQQHNQQQQRWGHSVKKLRSPLCSSVSPTQSSEAATPTKSPTLQLFSPCKINLFLRIIRKREDGFHDLASLFQAIGFGDTLELSLLDDDDEEIKQEDLFTCNMPGVPVDSSNLVLRALQLMRDKTGIQRYFSANLIKQVPAQAGLGGGSANAATALWGANQLLGEPATFEQMVEWSGALGSDITFFLSRGTAYCTGRGEIMDSIEPPLPSGRPVCIVKPNIGLSTPAVFKALEYDRLSTVDPDTELLPTFLNHLGAAAAAQNELPSSDYFINDLEFPAFKCIPELKQLKEELLQVKGFDRVMMSGSGTSIFCLGYPADVEQFERDFGQRDDLQVFFSEFISREEGKWFERPSTATAS